MQIRRIELAKRLFRIYGIGIYRDKEAKLPAFQLAKIARLIGAN